MATQYYPNELVAWVKAPAVLDALLPTPGRTQITLRLGYATPGSSSARQALADVLR